MLDELKFNNFFDVEVVRDGKVIHKERIKNGVTTEGKNELLDVMFGNASQSNPWYVGIMDNSGYSAENAADTLASHAGWTEFTNYTGNRLDWTEGAASAGSMSNASAVSFPILGTATLKGIFLCSVATGTSGVLWATAAFASTVPVNNGDTVNVTYTVNA